MNRFAIYSGSILLTGIIFFSSCTERIDIELDSTYTRLVVYSEITTENKHHTVKLSKTSDYFSNQEAPALTGALVEIIADTANYEFKEEPKTPGLYISSLPFKGIPGVRYELSIHNVDIDDNGEMESFTALSVMPIPGNVDSISFNYFESPFINGYQVSMYAFDPPEKQWYIYKLTRNGQLLTDDLTELTGMSDDFYNGNYIFGLPVGFLSNEDSLERSVPGDTITFELNSITSDYYEFISSAQSEIFGSNPLFGGPPANVKTNLDNGALGIFTTIAITKTSRIIPE
ncbi:MAG: DUF4249 domain-containing protein [Bacteroidales bacterium]|nr:DUF4249 domain-containing protein [Bacteroidales bacterium]